MHFCKAPVFIVAKVHSFILQHLCFLGASLVAQTIKNLPAVQETRVQSLGWKDPKEKGMATHSSILASEIPQQGGEPGGLQFMGSQRVRHGWMTNAFASHACYRASQVVLVVKNLPANAGDTGNAGSLPGLGRSPGVGNGNPLQYACLEKPMDRGAWRATVRGVTKNQTWLST